MTVAELIVHLQAFDARLEVVTSQCSSFCELSPPEIIMLMDKGGWLDHAFPPEEKWREKPYVFMG